MDDGQGEQRVDDEPLIGLLKGRALRIHIYAVVSGLAYAGWTVLAWEGPEG